MLVSVWVCVTLKRGEMIHLPKQKLNGVIYGKLKSNEVLHLPKQKLNGVIGGIKLGIGSNW